MLHIFSRGNPSLIFVHVCNYAVRIIFSSLIIDTHFYLIATRLHFGITFLHAGK